MKIKFVILFLVLSLGTLSMADFPVGSVVNFNPAYMTSNTKWSFSYEDYLSKGMDFVIFQPFENGFAGKLGFYSDEDGNGFLYSVATKKGNLSMGGDFELSSVGTRVGIEMGLGMVKKIEGNLYLDLRIPRAVSYVYGVGVKAYPNLRTALTWEDKSWGVGAFGSVNYPWISMGGWANLSFFGLQGFGYFETGYNSMLSGVVTEERFDFILQYSISSVKFAYIYDYISRTSEKTCTKQGIRISLDW